MPRQGSARRPPSIRRLGLDLRIPIRGNTPRHWEPMSVRGRLALQGPRKRARVPPTENPVNRDEISRRRPVFPGPASTIASIRKYDFGRGCCRRGATGPRRPRRRTGPAADPGSENNRRPVRDPHLAASVAKSHAGGRSSAAVGNQDFFSSCLPKTPREITCENTPELLGPQRNLGRVDTPTNNAIPSTVRVSRGSMMPSSYNRRALV